jgi:hypothetical protein
MPESQTRLHIVSRPTTSEPDVLLRNTLASVVHALSQLGYERRRRAARPRGYHYVRTDVPPSQRPSGFEETSEDNEEPCPSTQGDRS